MLVRISPELLRHYRGKYKKGSRVRLIYMDDQFSKLRSGEIGTVLAVDDIGTIHVSWDCGSSLGVVYGVDSCEMIGN